jgi:RNA polymerase sigma-70 factor, ECF subfamily
MLPLEEQFLAAYDAHADAIFRFCYAQCGNRELAHDLTQEAFVRTWQYLSSGKRIAQPKPFLYKIARNACIDHFRRPNAQSLERMREAGFDRADEHAVSPDVSAEATRVAQLVARLEPGYREAVALRYLDDLSPRDIAKILDVSETNASVRIHRGMQQLRELMGISNIV